MKAKKETRLFSRAGEKEVTRAIVDSFFEELKRYISSDVIIVGGGPSGLMAGKILAEKGKRVLIIERNNYLGGGFWIGGYFMNKLTLRAPSQKILEELEIPYHKYSQGLYVADGPLACSKLISRTCEAGCKILSLTSFEDLVLREKNRVAGAVVNWTPIENLPKGLASLDPIALESKILIDATGHGAFAIRKLEERGLIKISGCGAMWIEESEDLVVKYTQEVHPGLIAVGMAVSATYGLPRMGPTFGSMLLSGKKGAEIAIKKLAK